MIWYFGIWWRFNLKVVISRETRGCHDLYDGEKGGVGIFLSALSDNSLILQGIMN